MTPTYNIHSSTPPHSTVSSLHNPHEEEVPSLQRKNEPLPWVFEKSILTWLPPSSSLTGSSEKCIQLIRKAGDYRARTIDYLFFKVNKEIPVDLPPELVHQREEVIVNYLKKFAVSEQGDFEVTEPLSGYPVKTYGNQRITLRLRFNRERSNRRRSNKGHPVWFLYDSIENSVSWLKVSAKDSRILKGISKEERGAFFENYTVKIVAKNGRLRDIFLSRNSGPCTKSKLDASKSISEDFWAITLISSGRSSETDIGCGHAKIVYETFQRGIHSIFYAHLSARGARPGHAKVKVRKISLDDHDRIKWRKKSTTWIKPRGLVKRMIKEIQVETNTSIPFIHTGNPGLSTYLYSLRWVSGALIVAFIKAMIGFNPLIDQPFEIASWKIFSPIVFLDPLSYNRKASSYNCLTWAVKKIRLARVGLPFIQNIVAVPDLYIDYLRKLQNRVPDLYDPRNPHLYILRERKFQNIVLQEWQRQWERERERQRERQWEMQRQWERQWEMQRQNIIPRIYHDIFYEKIPSKSS